MENKHPTPREEIERLQFTGASFKACVVNGEGFLLGAAHAHHPCGCKITGNGTCPHPLKIIFCKKHGRNSNRPQRLQSSAASAR
mgnify:CR=1 FL=1